VMRTFSFRPPATRARAASMARPGVANGFAVVPGLASSPEGETKSSVAEEGRDKRNRTPAASDKTSYDFMFDSIARPAFKGILKSRSGRRRHHRGSARTTADRHGYLGDWILRTFPDLAPPRTEVVAAYPVPKHSLPAGVLDPAFNGFRRWISQSFGMSYSSYLAQAAAAMRLRGDATSSSSVPESDERAGRPQPPPVGCG